jgi:two-component system phosphate regulon sensor histidine kinase PhoR
MGDKDMVRRIALAATIGGVSAGAGAMAGWPAAAAAAGVAALAAFTSATTSERERVDNEPTSALPLLPADQVSIEAFSEPILAVTKSWRVEAANGPALVLLGERVVGEDLRVVLRNPAGLEAARAARAGRAVERELAGVGKGDNLFRLRAAPLGEGRVLLTFADISQVRMAERMRVDFVANASHELRTPLATILGFVETLQGPAADDERARHRFLDIMRREAGRMSRLIDDLLSLSRIELDKYVRPQTSLELGPLFSDVARTLAMRLESDQRPLLLDLFEPLPSVIGDRDQVLQVLHNLLSNALKYGRTGTPITLSAMPSEENGEAMLRITVTDQSEGIAPEHLPRLTERFYRVDTGRSRQMGGTGLGLAIVKHIVERHRGRLTIQSKQGEGTSVSFTLPVAASHN